MTASAYTLDIQTAQPYQVHIGTFLLEQVGRIARSVAERARRALVVTDSNVGPLYAAPVLDGLNEAGCTARLVTFEAGEEHKRIETLSLILERAAHEHLTRDDVIIALGGGVVGDVAGFAAATYMRGIAYVQVPTTLLAMVDSSVGGKTAIDLENGKNLAGAFWQPRAVIADVGCLGTLSDEQFADGCGEVVKHAVIADAELFEELERTPLTPDLLRRDLSRVAWLIARNIDIKRAVVEQDEREGGLRKLLNFGHSIGHGIEAAEVYREALHDKKRSGDTIVLVVPRGIGAAALAPTPIEEFHRILEVGLACTRAISAALMLFGAKGQRNARAATIRPDRLHGIELDAHDIPDLVPAIAAVRCEGPVEIAGAEAVNKSYPAFFDHYRLLGGDVELFDE